MKTLITILLLAFALSSQAQSFVGTLTYTADFEVSQKMLDMGMTKDMIKSRLLADGTWADTIKTTYKNGFYKQLNLSANNSWSIYRPDSNRIYTFYSGEDSSMITVADPSIDLESKMTGNMPSVTLLDTIVQYGEYQLKMVEVKWKSGTYFYLYSENHFKANAEDYKGHIYDGLYEFLKISNAYPIKIIKKAGKMMVVTISLATSSEAEIDDSIFSVPEIEEDVEANSLIKGMNLGYEIMKIKYLY